MSVEVPSRHPVWPKNGTVNLMKLIKDPGLEQVNQAVLQHLHSAHVEVELCRAAALTQRRGLTSECDAMWSYVGRKAEPRWLWPAIDHRSGTVLAYVFGRRQDTVFLQLKELLEPFGITRFFTDGWGAYERHLAPEQHTVGKQHTQTLVNVTDSKIIKLFVDDEPFWLPAAHCVRYDRRLNMQSGPLDREILWETPAGKQVS